MPKSLRTVLKCVAGLVCVVVMGFGVMVVVALVTGKPRTLQAAQPPGVPSSPPPSAARATNTPTKSHALPATPVAVDFASRLNTLEAAEDFVALNTLIADNPSRLSPDDRRAAIAWLRARQTSPNLPALFLMAALHEAGGDMNEASRCFVAASVIGRIDAVRCTDRSAVSAAPAMESRFVAVKAHLRANRDLAQSSMQSALDLEATLTDRPPAAWIARHGLQCMDGSPPKSVTDAEWTPQRERIRASLAKSIASAM